MDIDTEVTYCRATPADKATVLALSAKIEDDYLCYVFDDWVKEEPGGFYLARAGDRLVAVVSLTFTGPKEIFLRGMRVDPEFQGKGFGTAFASFQFNEALRLGADTVRLTTWEGNYRVHRMMERLGWNKAGEWLIIDELPVEAAATNRDLVAWRRAGPDDLPHVAGILAAYPPGPLVSCTDDYWELRSDTFDLETEIRAGRVILQGAAAAIMETYECSNQNGLVIRYIGGPHRAAVDLAATVPSIAAGLGVQLVCASIPAGRGGPLVEGLGLASPPPPVFDPASPGGFGPNVTPDAPHTYVFRAFVYEKSRRAAGL